MRAAVVRSHRQLHGDWCPGWGVPAHPSMDLTADHVIPYSTVGRTVGEYAVLCRSCNGRKGSRTELPSPLPSVASRNWLA